MVATVKVTLARVGGISHAPDADGYNVIENKDAVSTSVGTIDTGGVIAPITGPDHPGISTLTAYIRVSAGDVWMNSGEDTGTLVVGPGNGTRYFVDDKLFIALPPNHRYVAFSDDTG